MCNHVYTADYSDRPRGMGKQSPYPGLYRAFAAEESGGHGGGQIALPMDALGVCLFHSQDLAWKRANDLAGAFLRLAALLEVHGTERHYDFAEFVLVGSPRNADGGGDAILRIADVTFQKQAHFTAARFADPVEMERVRFPNGLEMDGATFAGDLTIRDAYINGAGMSGTRFERASFIGVEFASYALFDGARFTGSSPGGGRAVHFRDSRFRGLANFAGAMFDLRGDSAAAFERTSFEEFTDFRGTRFDCHTEFRYVTFADITDFIDTSFELVGSSARYAGAAVEFTGITVAEHGVVTFRSSDPGRRLFAHDVEMTFVENGLSGTVYFENVNLTSFVNGSRERLLELAREGRVQIGTGCIKYRVQTPLRTVPVEEGNAPLVVELCQTFANYFSATHGLNLGVEIVSRDRTRVSFFYYTDEDVSEAEFLERLAQTERGLWNLLSAGPHEQVAAIPGPGHEGPAREESAVINAVDGLSALLGTFFRVGARIAMRRWKEADTRALLSAIRFNEDGAELRAAGLHHTLVARYTESTLMGLNRQQNAQLVPIPPPAPDRARILFVGANSMSRPMDLELEVRCIQDSLRGSIEGTRLEFKQVPAATVDTLLRGILEESPAYVHFSGHGLEAGIYLRDELGAPRLVRSEPLAELFRQFRDTVRCVVLNSCFSAAQGRAIRRYIPQVIGMSERIPDSAAVAFSTGFYAAIGAGRDVPAAFEVARMRVAIDDPDSATLLTLL